MPRARRRSWQRRADMEFVAPLNSPHVTDEERRLRMQKGRTVKDGDYVGFDLAFMDNASATSGTMYFRDNQADVLTRIEAEVAQMRAAHDRKFAFLGDRAPVFDAANAFLVARCKVTDGGKGLENAMRAERSGGSGLATLATDARTEPASTDAQNYDRRALSRARYGV